MKSDLHAESLMMTYGYDPHQAMGSIKPPIFQTSTFAFKTAEHAKSFFAFHNGRIDTLPEDIHPYLYSRLSNPGIEIAEERLCVWEGAQSCALFNSGMAAISTVLLSHLKPGDLLLYSAPLYSGADIFINQVLPSYGIHLLMMQPGESMQSLDEKLRSSNLSHNLAFIYVETPVNPNLQLFDIALCKALAKKYSNVERRVVLAVDNTYMGPLWQKPLLHGADLVIYSATKYIGGHSDLIAGAVLGNSTLLKTLKTWRNNLGNAASPFTAWLVSRSLETLKLRMEKQQKNAIALASFFQKHAKIEKTYHLSLLTKSDPQYELYTKQYTGSGAMIAFDLKGGETAVFSFLNALKLVKIAVSLGSTESLAQHPYSMTHSGVDTMHLDALGITPNMVRFSVGIENKKDLMDDLDRALSAV